MWHEVGLSTPRRRRSAREWIERERERRLPVGLLVVCDEVAAC